MSKNANCNDADLRTVLISIKKNNGYYPLSTFLIYLTDQSMVEF